MIAFAYIKFHRNPIYSFKLYNRISRGESNLHIAKLWTDAGTWVSLEYSQWGSYAVPGPVTGSYIIKVFTQQNKL